MAFKLNPITGELDLVIDDHGDLDGLLDDDHTQYVLVDGTRPITGPLSICHLYPTSDAACDIGEDSTPLAFRTLYLSNDGGDIINALHAGLVGQKTEYTFGAGGGNLYGGDFIFGFEPAFQSQGSENRFIIEFGVVDVLGAQHAYVFRSTGNAPIVGDLQVETLFGGILGDGNLGIKFSSSGYFCYRNVINSNMATQQAFLADDDPQGTGIGGQDLDKKNFQIQMDGNTCFRINTDIGWNTFYGGVANMTPSPANYGTVAISGSISTRLGANRNTRSSLDVEVPTYDLNGFTLNYASAIRISGNPAGGAAGNCGLLMDSGASILFGQLGFGGVGTSLVGGNLFGPDILVASSATTNAAINLNLVPNGTSPNSKLALYNTVNWLFVQTYSVLDIEVNAAICNIMLRQVAATTPITTMNIGGNATSGLTTINFRIANAAIAYIDNTGLVIPSDTDGFFGGAGIDTSIIYDGTDWLFTSNLQNASDILIQCGTDKTVELLETVFDDLRVPGLSVESTGPNQPTLGAFLGAGGLQVWRFSGSGALEEVRFTVQLPHTYKEGTDIVPHVHWTPTDANAGNVVWQLEYTWININGTFGAATTITITDAASGTAWDHLVAAFAAISGTAKTISSMLVCRLFRDPAHGSDSYGFDAAFLEIDFHFEVNTMGSRQAFTK